YCSVFQSIGIAIAKAVWDFSVVCLSQSCFVLMSEMQCDLKTELLTGDREIELPSSLIVTNVPAEVFQNLELKHQFEALFKEVDETATFHYLSTFKRCRVQFCSSERATAARIHLDFTSFFGSSLRCFFTQVFTPKSEDDEHYLKLPQLEKQFLISPPASPPVGWEQSKESEPNFNFELLSRLAALAHEEPILELIPASSNCPSIKVHPCQDDEDDAPVVKPKIVHTARPPT
ncbi:Calcipressin-2, partial [Trichinella sp. T8]